MNRREFVMAAMLAPAGAGPAKLEPFPLGRVRLKPGPFLDAAIANRKYMASLPADRLLHTFRLTAGLPTSAAPLGGWEAPINELRGHFTGHYLSGCALRWAAFGDDEMKTRAAHLVAELAKCQKALGGMYLSAFPEEFFDRLRVGQNVWAPFYTIHKIMAGLLDVHQLCGNEQALAVLQGVAQWTSRWTQPLGDAHMARVLEREYGGMNEILYNLYGVTRSEPLMESAARFDHQRVFNPLAEGRDELKGLHANTMIPKIIGAARRYELTGERRMRVIAETFWRTVTNHRCYCTGGTSNGESWATEPGQLSKELSGYTQECCCTYNMLKLSRQVYGWTGDPRCMDYYERALLNGILGTIHPDDGMTVYYVPLQSGYWKLFGLPYDAFWCCTGSGVESFSKLADTVYWSDGGDLRVNLYVASELDWSEKKIRIVMDTRFPEEEVARLTIRGSARFALKLRIPEWTQPGGSVKVNGKPVDAFADPGGAVILDREWKDGETVELRLPMGDWQWRMPDDESMRAHMKGPLVLAADLGEEKTRATPTKPRAIPEYQSEPAKPPATPDGLALKPLYQMIDRRYATYWKHA